MEQVFGAPSLAWIFPTAPADLPCDGVSFPLYEDPVQSEFNPLFLK